MTDTLYIDNDMLVYLSGSNKLSDKDGNAITGATVEMTLYEYGTDTEVAGETWPVSFSDDGDGAYSAVLQDTVSLTDGDLYTLEITADGNGAQAMWYKTVKAEYRR